MVCKKKYIQLTLIAVLVISQGEIEGFYGPLLFLKVELCCPKMAVYSENIYLDKYAAVFSSECKTEGKRHRF